MMEVVGGDTGKFGVLYERYKAPVYGYFYKLTSGDRMASEDLSHNVFLKALKYKHSFQGTGTFAHWLFSIAHNLGIDYLRVSGRYTNNDHYPEPKDEGSDGHHRLVIEESRDLLNASMDRLSLKDREILIMAKIKELKYSGIAEIYGCSENAAKTRICRALRKLKDIYLKLENTAYEKRRSFHK